MENMPLISIIVPVFKVERYLDRCVESLVAQRYSHLEIILVDDGSPDSCGAMCGAWAEKDCRIKVIHKENGGLSDARNAGMAAATGELMGFVDSDDWISPEMYQLLYENMRETGSDIAACGVEMVWEDGSPSRMLTKTGCCVLDAQQAMRALIEESALKQPVWYKLYKTDLIRDIPFAAGRYHEDVFWSYQAIGAARCVSVIDTPCYYYTQRSGSIMGESFSMRRLDILDAKLLRLEYIKNHYPALTDLTKRELFMFCLWTAQMNEKHFAGVEKSACKKKILHIWEQVKDAPVQTVKDLVWLTMARISFDSAVRIRNMLGIGV